ncbi:MAG: hypothetical protein BWY79_02069 [Actinobacteria bacterium ADurb.Bin444]|nr:MAG: hypothetical protein BWY79_02069 [Actinobacteria bacterium ADurb.Bin444]
MFGGQATGYFTLDDNGQVVSLKEPVARGNRGGGAGGLAAAQTVPKSRITLSQIATMADSSKTDTPLQVADLPPLIAQISDPGERAMAEAWYSQKVRGHREAEVAAQVAAWDSYYEKEAEYEVAMARAQKVNGGWWKGNDVEWPEKPKPPEFPDPRKQPAAPQVAPEELLGYGMGPIRTAPTVTIAPDGLEVILED